MTSILRGHPGGAMLVRVVVTAVAIVTTAFGAAWTVRARSFAGDRNASVEGLELQLVRALWVDHREGDGRREDTSQHGLAPGMPGEGHARLATTWVARNVRTDGADVQLEWQELVVRAGRSEAFGAGPSQSGVVVLPARHTAAFTLWFDLPASDELVSLNWERARERKTLLVTRTPRHLASAAAPRWPEQAEDLPPGRAEVGAELYRESAGCLGCHGDPGSSESVGPAPALHRIGVEAATRARGRTARQYLYRSLLAPAEVVAPSCAAGSACAAVAMPAYGDRLSAQDAADLIAFLLEQRQVEATDTAKETVP